MRGRERELPEVDALVEKLMDLQVGAERLQEAARSAASEVERLKSEVLGKKPPVRLEIQTVQRLRTAG